MEQQLFALWSVIIVLSIATLLVCLTNYLKGRVILKLLKIAEIQRDRLNVQSESIERLSNCVKMLKDLVEGK